MNALVPQTTPDEWSDAVSPIVGPNLRFDGNAFVLGTAKTPVKAEAKYFVITRQEGWQRLRAISFFDPKRHKPG